MLNDLEVSARKKWQELPFKSFRSVHYSEFDVCKDTLPERFDLIIADQNWGAYRPTPAGPKNSTKSLRRKVTV
jgi:hypothetical protein